METSLSISLRFLYRTFLSNWFSTFLLCFFDLLVEDIQLYELSFMAYCKSCSIVVALTRTTVSWTIYCANFLSSPILVTLLSLHPWWFLHQIQILLSVSFFNRMNSSMSYSIMGFSFCCILCISYQSCGFREYSYQQNCKTYRLFGMPCQINGFLRLNPVNIKIA